MIRVDSSAKIARSPEEVFDFLVDLRNDLKWNPRAIRVEMLTPAPIAIGTKFEGDWKSSPRTSVEVLAIDGKRSCETIGRAKGMLWHYRFQCVSDGAFTNLDRTLEISFSGLLALFAPFLGSTLRKQSATQTQQIKQALERGHSTRV